MNFQELAATLPNGFHDAELRRIDMDYVQRKLRLDLAVWIGDLNNDTKREVYRQARVTLDRVGYFVIEPPDSREPLLDGDGIRIAAGDDVPRQASSRIPDSPDGNSAAWLFLNDLNAFLLFSAAEASLEWTGPEENRA